MKAVRVYDEEGVERCAACWTELRNGKCRRCAKVKSEALPLADLIPEQE